MSGDKRTQRTEVVEVETFIPGIRPIESGVKPLYSSQLGTLARIKVSFHKLLGLTNVQTSR